MLTAPGPSGAQPWVSLDPAWHGEPWVRELVASACGGTERGTGLGDATAWWHVSPCPRVLSIHPSGKHKAGGSMRLGCQPLHALVQGPGVPAVPVPHLEAPGSPHMGPLTALSPS